MQRKITVPIVHATKSNVMVWEGPGGVDCKERASFWQEYMEDHFIPRFRDVFNTPTEFPIYVRMFNHTYAAQIGMYHYMYLMTEDTGYRDE
jgi:hypothetical protein